MSPKLLRQGYLAELAEIVESERRRRRARAILAMMIGFSGGGA